MYVRNLEEGYDHSHTEDMKGPQLSSSGYLAFATSFCSIMYYSLSKDSDYKLQHFIIDNWCNRSSISRFTTLKYTKVLANIINMMIQHAMHYVYEKAKTLSSIKKANTKYICRA